MQGFRTVGLFAGIGGIELGLERAGHATQLLCENWAPAISILEDRFTAPLRKDVRSMRRLPSCELVAAGFPCTDLSQAGRTAGIRGAQSSLVGEAFRLIDRSPPRWLLLENVRNMIPLDRGRAMRYLVNELEERGYRWAYRVVDSRFSGVPQRRHRVLLLAGRKDDPREVLLSEDAGQPAEAEFADDAYGFYWTEGLRGLGWAPDATPPLKGGSGLGIPSPPAIWVPDAAPGRALVVPTVDDAEVLQGFPRGWTAAAPGGAGVRWTLVGNAVTVPVARWVGERLLAPTPYDSSTDSPLGDGDRWPEAAWGDNGRRFRANLSAWPCREPYAHLAETVDLGQAPRLSHRGAAGFLNRMSRSRLRFLEEFRIAVKEHVEATAVEGEVGQS